MSFSFINYAAHCLAWLSYGKDCGRGKERLDAKALAVYHVVEGAEGGSKIPSALPACISLSKCPESAKTDL